MNDEQLLRYSRQIMLPDIEIEGQEKLLAAKAIIIGAGGLGCPVGLYLAAAGVGHLVIIDDDEVDLSNLQRQIAHGVNDINHKKADSLAQSIGLINPTIRVTALSQRIIGDELDTLLAKKTTSLLEENPTDEVAVQTTIVVDCTDNFETRFRINAACVRTKTALVSGAAIKLEGQVMVYDPAYPDCACYQCLYQSASDQQLSCAENGIAAPVVGIIGSIQAMEAIKLIIGKGETLAGHLLIHDAKTMDWRKLKLPKNPNCSVCSPSASQLTVSSHSQIGDFQ